jgi:hypothetical protein
MWIPLDLKNFKKDIAHFINILIKKLIGSFMIAIDTFYSEMKLLKTQFYDLEVAAKGACCVDGEGHRWKMRNLKSWKMLWKQYGHLTE